MQYTHSTRDHFGALIHTVHTDNREFAYRLFEQALKTDIEPDITRTRTGHAVEFIATVEDAIEALNCAGSGM